MPGGHRNPFNVNNVLEQIDGAVHHASVTKPPAEEQLLDISYVDLQIQVCSQEPTNKLGVHSYQGFYVLEVYRGIRLAEDGYGRVGRSLFYR
jgi:hypothetical protein